jgi:type IV pilus assembly protein PilX
MLHAIRALQTRLRHRAVVAKPGATPGSAVVCDRPGRQIDRLSSGGHDHRSRGRASPGGGLGGAARRQRGLSLLFALMALAAMSLAAAALVRSVDTGALVIGNLGFKQDATAAAAQGAEQAITWLQDNMGTNLQTDQPTKGYYAASRDMLDVTGQNLADPTRAVVDWVKDDCDSYASYGSCITASAELTLNDGANHARYVITRLCATEGNPSLVDCAFPFRSATSSGGNKGMVDYKVGRAVVAVSTQQYYRIVVRAQSARGTVAFTETIVQL